MNKDISPTNSNTKIYKNNKATKKEIIEFINDISINRPNNNDILPISIANKLGWLIEDLEIEIMGYDSETLYKWKLLKQHSEIYLINKFNTNSDIIVKTFNRNTAQSLKGNDNTYQPIIFLESKDINEL